MKRKGIALPIDMLVILAIAVIILIAVVAVFMGVWTPFAGGQQARANFNKECQILVNTGCAGNPSASLCEAANGVVMSKKTCDSPEDMLAVKVGCGCPNVAPLGSTTPAPSGGSASLKANGASCTADAECQSGKCPVPGIPSPESPASPRVCVA